MDVCMCVCGQGGGAHRGFSLPPLALDNISFDHRLGIQVNLCAMHMQLLNFAFSNRQCQGMVLYAWFYLGMLKQVPCLNEYTG